MQRRSQRARISRAAYRARGPSRARRGRQGRARQIRGARFIPGFDRRGGFYARFGYGGEKKFFDTNVDDAVVSGNMTINNLTIIPEGNGESARIGRKVTIKKIHVRGQLSLPSQTAATATSGTVICMLVQDMQTNGQVFAATDLLETDSFIAFRNLANSKRFKVLYKKVYTLRVGGAAPSGAAFVFGEDVRSINVNVNTNIEIEYDNSATSGVLTTVRSNNLYWVTQANTGTMALVANVRLRYSDR